MAKKKKEEKKKKTKQKRTRRMGITGLSVKYDKHGDKIGDDADRQMRIQSDRNKANFVERRTMFKKSRLAENFDAGRLNMKDLKEINEHFADSDRNKATLLKRIIKKAKRTRPKK